MKQPKGQRKELQGPFYDDFVVTGELSYPGPATLGKLFFWLLITQAEG